MDKSLSTRNEILYLLKMNDGLTVTEMAQTLEITEMAVRRHLNTLERDGIVKTRLVRQAMGRPIHLYLLSEKGTEMFPRQYEQLLLQFLQELEDLVDPEIIETLFHKRKDAIKDTYIKHLKRLHSKEKVEGLAQLQEENGYMTEVEQREDGSLVLKQFNCPISKVAKEYHVACQCELELFKEILDTDEIECKGRLSEGNACCEYVIRP